MTKLRASLADDTLVRIVLSHPTDAKAPIEKVLARMVKLKSIPHLSITTRYATKDETKNLPVDEAGNWIREQIGTTFRSALLGTTRRDWQLSVDDAGAARLVGHKPSATELPSRAHDQERESVLDESAHDWLRGLGIVGADGKVRASMADKYSQINRYLEIVTHLAKECEWTGDARAKTQRREVVLADMGSGKGYLTFGLWHLFHRVWKQPVRVIGVDARGDLVKTTNGLARTISAEGLEFREGTIESTKLPGVDALIALHACNTATDDAILRGIELGAGLIVVAPCCHKEVRPQLGKPAPLAPVLEHGIMAERMAEWATDGLRALFLEWAGYRAKVMEFVSSEHTPKNLMIAAIRPGPPFTSKEARQRIEAFKTFFGIRRHTLDSLLARG